MSYRQQTAFGGSVSIGMRHWLGSVQQHTGLSDPNHSDTDMLRINTRLFGGFMPAESENRKDDALVNKPVTTTRGHAMDRDTRKALLLQVHDDEEDEDDGVCDVVPQEVETTPVLKSLSHLGVDTEQDVSPPKSMNKHLDGMFDAIMREMFSPEVGGKALSFEEDEDFKILASPSPHKKQRHKMDDDRVVLDMGNGSPLLKRMREIEERKRNIMPVATSPQVEETALDMAEQGVAPLVHYFETGGAQKPPLPGIGHHLRISYAKLKKKSPVHVGRIFEDTILPFVMGKRTTLYNLGKPRLWAVVAIAYIVLIHILLIGSKLHRQ